MDIVKLDGGSVYLEQVLVAENVAERARGLLGSPPPPPGWALYLAPCCSVHSFGMRHALDLVYLDRQGRICKLVHGFRPWRVSVSLRAYGTLELAAGEARRLGLEVGQEVQWHET